MNILLGYGKIVLSSVCIYLFIILAIRLFGKKELAQLSVMDLVFILLISNSVQNAMVGTDSSLVGGLVAAGALFAVNWLFKYLIFKFPRLEKTIQGKPVMLVYKGKVSEENLIKARITIAELNEAVREHGVLRIEDVDLAILEPNGNISILSDAFKRHTETEKTRGAG